MSEPIVVTPDETMNFVVGGDRPRDIVIQIGVVDRTL